MCYTTVPEPHPEFTGYTIAPGSDIEAVFENTNINPDDIRALLADPRSVTFEVARYSMSRVDATGTPTMDYTALAESITRQDGLIVVDSCNGRVERHALATNLMRDADGLPMGGWAR